MVARNFGLMLGGVDLNAGSDSISNSGTIDGDVLLDEGADTYDGRGGAGDDTYIVDDSVVALVENAGEGTDEVRAAVDYVLGDSFENLTLLGTSGLSGTGNALRTAPPRARRLIWRKAARADFLQDGPRYRRPGHRDRGAERATALRARAHDTGDTPCH